MDLGLLSEGARRLLHEAITSVWALELLLLIRKEPERGFTIDGLVRELRANHQLVSTIVAKFKTRGLASETGDLIRYTPVSMDIGAAVDEIERVYAQTPLALIKEIADAPNEKIRAFSDAFKLKRD